MMLACLVPRQAHAQFIGYVSPQTVQQGLATNVACNGSTQTYNVSNLGQTQHYLSITSSSGVPQQFQAEIDGIDNAGNSYRISDTIDQAGSTAPLTVSGTGYFPQIQILVKCSPASAHYTLSYSGVWATANLSAGSYLLAQIDKIPFQVLSAGSNQSDTFQTPYGSSAGLVVFNGNVPANSTLTINCDYQSGTEHAIETFALVNGITTDQNFQVPDFSCPKVRILYTSGGASANTINTEYTFQEPGRLTAGNLVSHITGTTATVVKTGPGSVHSLSINTGGAGTVSIFDLATAACTGTPSTNTLAVVTATATTLQSFIYDIQTTNGICVKASVAMDLTVSFQ